MNFYEFDIPMELNGSQLKAKLGCDEVYIRDNKLVIGGNLSEAEALAGLLSHKPVPVTEPTIEQKLASVGLTLPDLKSALGL